MAAKDRLSGEEKRARQDAAGIPDSVPFVASAEERVESAEDKIRRCHINGVLIGQMELPPQVIVALDYWSTDEGIAEAAARPNVREASGVKLGAGPFEKCLEEKRDDVKQRGMDLGDARDPLKEVADLYAVPGMDSRFLGRQRLKDNGGAGDYQIVRAPNGDPVTVHGLTLGHIPSEIAAKRRRYQARRGEELLKQIGEEFKKTGGPTAVADQ
jgi:hypothetical protein